MAHKKGAGRTRNGRDSQSKRLGVKIFGGQKVASGMIIVRQRGSRFFAGDGVARGGDDTLYAKRGGIVTFSRSKVRKFTGRLAEKTFVSVK